MSKRKHPEKAIIKIGGQSTSVFKVSKKHVEIVKFNPKRKRGG
ncbi:unnamed protein product [marine sediment metagenome]|uniref:Uncharacterized protein n=1 Tax=marine sediment metagenome TaxID=412755 RepID=X1F2B9_9ZZZZ